MNFKSFKEVEKAAKEHNKEVDKEDEKVVVVQRPGSEYYGMEFLYSNRLNSDWIVSYA